MSDQELKQQQQSTNISPQPSTDKKKESTELSEEEMNKVSSGR
jgi:hypothetical protein